MYFVLKEIRGRKGSCLLFQGVREKVSHSSLFWVILLNVLEATNESKMKPGHLNLFATLRSVQV